jgi:hypothetical protein
MEQHVIGHLNGQTRGYKFVGIDINSPTQIPAGVEFRQMNMKDLGENMPNEFRRLYLIWSPWMDVLEFDEMLDVAESLALACQIPEVDEPNNQPEIYLDVHFWDSSYEK